MGYDMYQGRDGEGDYFRLNIGGMGEYRRRMADIGMLVVDAPYTWPKSSDFGFTDTDSLYAAMENDPDLQSKWNEAQEKITLTPYSDTPTGIPAYKLGSNDGWLVTPSEIQAAFTLSGIDIDAIHTERKSRPDQGEWDEEAYWLDWLLWLHASIDAGGFRVW